MTRQTPEPRHAAYVLALISIVFLLRTTLALWILPPWQKPDEPQHLERIRIIMQRDSFDLTVRTDPSVQAEILTSMAAFDWWRHIFAGTPQPLPKQFNEDWFFGRVTEGMVHMPPVYYALVTPYLRLYGATDLLAQYRAARLLSILFALLTIWCLWAAARQATQSEAAATSIAFLLALHPQFLQVATAVNPDALVNLLGAVVYWQLTRVADDRRPRISLAVLIGAAILSVFTKRIGAPLLVVACVTIAWRLHRAVREDVDRGAALTAVAAASLVFLIASVRLIGGTGTEIVQHWEDLLAAPLRAESLSLDFFQQFGLTLVDSAWLRFGWMAYRPGPIWIAIARSLTLATVVGCIVGLARGRDPRATRAIGFASMVVLVQVAAIYATYYPRAMVSQGRYLFPAIGPALVLLWLGTRELWPERYRQVNLVALPLVFLALDAAAWALYIIPAYRT